MTVSFEEKLRKLSPEARTEVEKGAKEIRAVNQILRAIRESSGYTQLEISALLDDFTQSKLSRIENGERKLTFDTFSQIVHSLGLEWEIKIKRRDGQEHVVFGSDDLDLTGRTMTPYKKIQEDI